MNKKQENKTPMYGATDQCLDNAVAIWDPNIGFKKYALMYKSELAKLIDLSVIQQQDITGFAMDKEDTKEELITLTMQIASALFALSFDINDNALGQAVNISASTLRDLRDNDLYAKTKDVLDRAVKYADKIATFGASQEMLDKLKENNKNFKGIISSPRTMIGTRKDATERIAEQIEKIDDILKGTLDKLITLYEFTHPDFYNKYKAARIIVDLGIRHKKEVEES